MLGKQEWAIEGVPQYNVRSPIRWIMSHIARYPWLPVVVVCSNIVGTALVSYAPVLLGHAFDMVSEPQRSAQALLSIAGLILLTHVGAALIDMLKWWVVEVLAQRVERGLAADVGERGASLSMGQRQLVALAHVLLHDPAILILDEATASVDPFTELQIQEGLDRVIRGRTSIVVAHRLSTVRNADRIIVLQQGRIIEQGNHVALLERGGHYAELYNTYFRHQSLSYIEQVGHVLE